MRTAKREPKERREFRGIEWDVGRLEEEFQHEGELGRVYLRPSA